MSSLTLRGRALLIAGCIALGIGWGLGEPPLLAVAALLIALPVLGVLVTRRARIALGSARTVTPSRLPIGESAQVELTIENASRLTGNVLQLQDSTSETLSEAAHIVLDRIPAQARRAVRYSVTGLERGRARIGPLVVTVTDPFGTASATKSFAATNPVIVTPRIVPLPDGGTSLSPGGRGETLFRSVSSRGDDDVLPREHRPGDDMRRIHWRATARQGDLMVRREEQPWHSGIVVILDTREEAHSGHGQASTFEWAVSAAASIAVHYLRLGWRVTAITTTGRLLVETTGSSGAEIDAALQAFSEVRLTAEHMASDLGSGLFEATAIIAVLGRITDDAARVLIRPMTGFTGCLLLEPGPVDLLESRGWHTSSWTRSTDTAEAWQQLMPARSAGPIGRR